MRVTNLYHWPEALVRAVEADPYTRGESDISCTQLIGPPQIRVLTEQHWDDIEVDVSDQFYSLYGSAIHHVLELAASKLDVPTMVERRFFQTVEGWVVSGQADMIFPEDGLLQDYKYTSVWSVVFGKPEWEEQINVLAELAESEGVPIRQAEIIGLFRDWQKSKVGDGVYPDQQVQRVPIELWDRRERQAFITDRVRLHQRASEGEHIPCTDEERWLRGEQWRVVKRGRKSALRVLKTEAEALDWLCDNGLAYHDGNAWILDTNIEIEHRPGRYVRCEEHCPVRQFCPQWASEKREVS